MVLLLILTYNQVDIFLLISHFRLFLVLSLICEIFRFRYELFLARFVFVFVFSLSVFGLGVFSPENEEKEEG